MTPEREIKFKVWHRNRKEMFWYDLMWGNVHAMGGGWLGVLPIGEERDYGWRDNRIAVDPNDCDILQFTGLKDKNGKEIYEGDILRIHNAEEDDGENYKYSTIEFKNGAFKVEYDFGDYDMTAIGWAIDIWDNQKITCEIIGNIYETPELLNRDKNDERIVETDAK